MTLRLKYTKFDFRWGSAPEPVLELTVLPPDLLAVFKGFTSKGRGEGKGWEKMGQKWTEGERRGKEKGKGSIVPPF